MTDVKWEDPPPKRQSGRPVGTGKFESIAASLKANPNRWALVQEGVKPGCVRNWRRRGFETGIRTAGTDQNGSRIFNIYARYNEEAP